MSARNPHISSSAAARGAVAPRRGHARPRGAARREALLDAVIRIVADVGADAVTHRRVAEVAGLPLASTTYWFDSKEHLLTAALERAAASDIARLEEFLNGVRDPNDPLELAVEVVLGPGEETSQNPRGSLLATYALVLEAARRPALRAVTTRWTDAYLRATAALLEAAGSQDPPADAQLLLAAADGLFVEQLASGDESDLKPRLRRLASALVSS